MRKKETNQDTGLIAQVVEHVLSIDKALNSSPSTTWPSEHMWEWPSIRKIKILVLELVFISLIEQTTFLFLSFIETIWCVFLKIFLKKSNY